LLIQNGSTLTIAADNIAIGLFSENPICVSSNLAIKQPSAARQVRFHQLLIAARKTWLTDALSDALMRVDPNGLKVQLTKYVPADVQQLLAAAGIRDEHVFPTPLLLEAKPTLVGYYRLLLGLPQKTFYGRDSGMGRFKRLEAGGVLRPADLQLLPLFCEVMGLALADLVRQMSPSITERDLAELPLLALGSQFQGGNNNAIGKQATLDTFLSIAEIVNDYIIERNDRILKIRNASGRIVIIALASDPDVAIKEDFGDKEHNKVAIEIKGGTDVSNAHNRAGEAEKSHQKAKNNGYRDFWTVIAKRGIDMQKLQAESRTTNSWFDAAHVLGRVGTDWEDFRRRIAEAVGIPLT
jgi:hypothetical protein